MKETFVKVYILERTNKAKTKPEEQSEKAESCRDNLWNAIQLKGPLRQKQTKKKKQSKGVGKLGWLKSDINRNTPTTTELTIAGLLK